MNREFMKNMILAKKYEREALRSLLSPAISEHLQIIEKEVKGMIIDVAKEWALDINGVVSDVKEEQADDEKKAKKIVID
ncbi:hypothetical protein [Acetobacterium woodii]|uniref:hypothetical protein n=1 Tax=Acetobacterium woodii TaxID=33952 RepID=UPI00030F5653|nr:hypothetical protein [Acetobacterium woodii]